MFKDISLRLAPVGRDTALEMIGELKGSKILMGARGRAKADINALADAIVRFSHLAIDNKAVIGEMDINPLIVLDEGKGVRAVDALVVHR